MTDLPLSGIRIIEFAGIGPAPFAGQVFADMGAEVIVIDRPKRGDIAPQDAVDRRGKRSIVLDLKSEHGQTVAQALIKTADALIEGNRPGVMERLGLGPDACRVINPKLIFGRMTGWGQVGPKAHLAGHDINYLSLTGALQAMGPRDLPPPPPLNLVGDYGGGSMFLVSGVLAAMLRAKETGHGCVVDAAICDGVNAMMGMFHSLDKAGRWTTERHDNWLDGAAPYYRCYETADGRFMAVGSIEPQFFSLMLGLLNIDPQVFGDQHNVDLHHRQAEDLTVIFLQKTMAEWTAIFDESDACVTPVLNYHEAASHPHMVARQALQKVDGLNHPAPSPRFGNDSGVLHRHIPTDGEDSADILAVLGISIV